MSEEQKILPEGWKWVKLGDLCTRMSNGANVKQADDIIGLPITRIETIWNESIDLNRVKYIVEDSDQFIEKYGLLNNDILFSHINSDTHLGKTAIFKQQVKTLIHGINLLLIRLDKNVDADFINYQFKYKRKKGNFISIAQKSVNQSSINQAKLKNVEFILPPLTTQQAIVSKIEELFSELNNGIAQLKTAQQQLNTYRQSVLKWAFEGRLTNKDVKDGELPEGWEIRTLKEITTEKNGLRRGPFGSAIKKSFFVPKGYKVYEQGNAINDDPYRGTYFISEEKYQELINFEVLPGDLIVSCSGVTLGRICEIPLDAAQGVINQALLRIRLKKGIVISKYFIQYFRAAFFQKKIFAQSQGTAMPNLVGIKDFKEIELYIPSIEIQNHIVQEIESRLSVADKLQETIDAALAQSESLRQSILKQAFEGKLVREEKQEVKKKEVSKFERLQLVGYLIHQLAKKEIPIKQGEMGWAKQIYCAQEIYDVDMALLFQNQHLGPFDPDIKQILNNRRYFKKIGSGDNQIIEVINTQDLFKYHNEGFAKLDKAIEDIYTVFSKYPSKDRSKKAELLATVCKCIQDNETTDIDTIRQAMKDWKIDLKNEPCKNKAEKFSEEETRKCIGFIVSKGWDKKLIQNPD